MICSILGKLSTDGSSYNTFVPQSEASKPSVVEQPSGWIIDSTVCLPCYHFRFELGTTHQYCIA